VTVRPDSVSRMYGFLETTSSRGSASGGPDGPSQESPAACSLHEQDRELYTEQIAKPEWSAARFVGFRDYSCRSAIAHLLATTSRDRTGRLHVAHLLLGPRRNHLITSLWGTTSPAHPRGAFVDQGQVILRTRSIDRRFVRMKLRVRAAGEGGGIQGRTFFSGDTEGEGFQAHSRIMPEIKRIQENILEYTRPFRVSLKPVR